MGGMRLVTISGLPAVDRSAPVVRGIEKAVAVLGGEVGYQEPRIFNLSECVADEDDFLTRYPYQRMLWLPLRVHDSDVLGGMLLASEQAWAETDIVIAKRMAATCAHALAFLLADSRKISRLTTKFMSRRKLALATAIAVLAAMTIPVPMTALAPLEITPRDPFVVSAPIEGAIEDVLVPPNEPVKEGQPIVRFEDTALRNNLEVAERQVLVAEARLKQASQLAFDEIRGRHELGLAMAEHALKTAELDFAREMFERATIRAPRAGIAIYSDRQELIGKPVTLGERIMQIADPAHIEVGIDVDVGDSIVLRPGAAVKVFLDSDPLVPRQAKVEFADYQARIRPGNALAFHVVARLTDADGEIPRLGAHGTAQLYGEDVPLALYLFRRPLSALRQWIGI
jgi:multidrug resistance efflux pump